MTTTILGARGAPLQTTDHIVCAVRVSKMLNHAAFLMSSSALKAPEGDHFQASVKREKAVPGASRVERFLMAGGVLEQRSLKVR